MFTSEDVKFCGRVMLGCSSNSVDAMNGLYFLQSCCHRYGESSKVNCMYDFKGLLALTCTDFY